MNIDIWLAASLADADARGLPELKPLLQGLAEAARALRSADAPLDSPNPPRPESPPSAK